MEEPNTDTYGGRITRVEQQKNNSSRYNIYINDNYALSVHQEILIKYRLFKGRPLDPETIQEVLLAEERSRAEQYALGYLGDRPRSRQEVVNYLTNKGFTAEDIQQVVDTFCQKGYIDDKEYARQWIEERKQHKPRGRYMLKQELLNKGIQEEWIEQATNDLLSDEDEREMIRALIAKKFRRREFKNEFERKKKMVPYLQRKGFPLETILSVLNDWRDDHST